MNTYKVEVNGYELQVNDCPNENKGTILGIHGLTGNALQLGYYAKHFSKDYRFITMDLRGRGNSRIDSEEGSIDGSIFQHADDIVQLIKKLDLDNIILFGYSMGGFIACIVASKLTSVKGVVLLDGAATMSNHQRPIVEPSLGRLSKHYESKEQYISEVSASYKGLGIPISEELTNLLAYEIEDKGGYWENKASEIVVRNDWESFWDFDANKVGDKMQQPVLLIQASGSIGNNPPLFLPEHYVNTINSIKDIKVVVSDCNHYTMVFEEREDIYTPITNFLRKVK